MPVKNSNKEPQVCLKHTAIEKLRHTYSDLGIVLRLPAVTRGIYTYCRTFQDILAMSENGIRKQQFVCCTNTLLPNDHGILVGQRSKMLKDITGYDMFPRGLCNL